MTQAAQLAVASASPRALSQLERAILLTLKVCRREGIQTADLVEEHEHISIARIFEAVEWLRRADLAYVHMGEAASAWVEITAAGVEALDARRS